MHSRGNTRPRVRTSVAAIGIAGLIAIAGCGDGDETGTPDTTTTPVPSGQLSAGKLASTADGICTAANDEAASNAEIPSFGKDGLQSEEVEASNDFWEVNAEAQAGAHEQLSQLQPPPGLQKKWDQFLDLFQQGRVDYSNDLADASVDGNTETFFDAALAAQAELAQLDASAKGLGMKVCGASQLEGVS